MLGPTEVEPELWALIFLCSVIYIVLFILLNDITL